MAARRGEALAVDQLGHKKLGTKNGNCGNSNRSGIPNPCCRIKMAKVKRLFHPQPIIESCNALPQQVDASPQAFRSIEAGSNADARRAGMNAAAAAAIKTRLIAIR